MTLPWNTCTRSLLPSTTRTCTFSSSPGAKWGMSSRNWSLSMRSVAFMADRPEGVGWRPRGGADPGRRVGLSRIRDRRELFQQASFLIGEAAAGLDDVRSGGDRSMERLGVAPPFDQRVV